MKDMSKYIKIIEDDNKYSVILFIKLFAIIFFTGYFLKYMIDDLNVLNYIVLYTVILGNLALDFLLQKRYHSQVVETKSELNIKSSKDAISVLSYAIEIENKYNEFKEIEGGIKDFKIVFAIFPAAVTVIYLCFFCMVFYRILNETDVNLINIVAMIGSIIIMLICVKSSFKFGEKKYNMLLSIEENMLNKNKNIIFEKDDDMVEVDSLKKMKELVSKGYGFNVEILEKRIN